MSHANTAADPATYLKPVIAELRKHWPENRRVDVVCHGHSVPAGYTATPLVASFDAYPHLVHRGIKERFPYAVVNVMVTAIGGENSEQGAARFAADVLALRPMVVTIDYGLNDRRLGLERAATAWNAMITAALTAGARPILCTPTLDSGDRSELDRHTAQIRALAATHGVGLADVTAAWDAHLAAAGSLADLLSWSNHPNRLGHELAARPILRFFSAG